MRAAFPGLPFPTEVPDVRLDDTRKRFVRLSEHAADEACHPPGRLVRHLEVALYRLRGKSALRARKHRECMEPERERNLRLLEDRPSHRGDVVRAPGALVRFPCRMTAVPSSAGTAVPVVQAEEVCETGIIGGESFAERPKSERIRAHASKCIVGLGRMYIRLYISTQAEDAADRR